MPLNGAVGVYVTNGGGTSPAQSATTAPYAPGVFTYARTVTAVDPIIAHLDNSLVTPDKPANPGETLWSLRDHEYVINPPPSFPVRHCGE